jgi:mono/diheme cytochrome c family protein
MDAPPAEPNQRCAIYQETWLKIPLEEGRTMRISTLYLSALLVFFGGNETIFAQNAENGQRLSERWCLPCHAVSPAPGKIDRPRSLESIANTENVNFDKIVSFLLLPHGRMPNYPLGHKDAGDIAAYISHMKK